MMAMMASMMVMMAVSVTAVMMVMMAMMMRVSHERKATKQATAGAFTILIAATAAARFTFVLPGLWNIVAVRTTLTQIINSLLGDRNRLAYNSLGVITTNANGDYRCHASYSHRNGSGKFVTTFSTGTGTGILRTTRIFNNRDS